MDTGYLTVAEVATRLRVHPDSVRRWLNAGQLRGVQLGRSTGWRIDAADLAAFIAARTPAPATPLPDPRPIVEGGIGAHVIGGRQGTDLTLRCKQCNTELIASEYRGLCHACAAIMESEADAAKEGHPR